METITWLNDLARAIETDVAHFPVSPEPPPEVEDAPPLRLPRWQNDALKLFTEEERAEVVRLYTEEKLNMVQVTERMNQTGQLDTEMKRSHVNKILEMARVATRPQTEVQGKISPRSDRTPIPGIDKEYVYTSIHDLATKYHRDPLIIRMMLEDLDVQIRPPGRPPAPKPQ